MATYAIGDIQGCYDELRRLLDKLDFDPSNDRLWFAGDLVNRGPKSLKTLRFIKSLGDSAICVLGNHDLHLLATIHGIRPAKAADRCGRVLGAKDRDELVDWLRQQPLLHHDKKRNFTMIHAGLPPQWTLQKAQKLAAEVEARLRSDDYVSLLGEMYGNQPDRWSKQLSESDRHRFVINCLTRLRYCSAEGQLDFGHSGPPGTQPDGLQPWYTVENRKSQNERFVIGHWSALGAVQENGVYSLDTGCVWGGSLTALNLKKLKYTSQSCPV